MQKQASHISFSESGLHISRSHFITPDLVCRLAAEVRVFVVLGSKNEAVDVFALGFVVSLPFTKNEGDGSVSFLVCIAEFVYVRHTDKGYLKMFLQAS